jgi:hypothetical protein
MAMKRREMIPTNTFRFTFRQLRCCAPSHYRIKHWVEQVNSAQHPYNIKWCSRQELPAKAINTSDDRTCNNTGYKQFHQARSRWVSEPWTDSDTLRPRVQMAQPHISHCQHIFYGSGRNKVNIGFDKYHDSDEVPGFRDLTQSFHSRNVAPHITPNDWQRGPLFNIHIDDCDSYNWRE